MQRITSESVFSGHPDKVCDQISDGILDAILEQDKDARVAVETAIKDNFVFIFGEVTTTALVNYKAVAKTVLKDIGYDEEFVVMELISRQSPDIALGVNESSSKEQGAGDQGIMFGYACNETEEFMPLPIILAHRIAKGMDKARKEKYSHIFGPDGKCQVSVDYKDGKPYNIPVIVVSAQTKQGVTRAFYEDIIKAIIFNSMEQEDLIKNTRLLINPTGEFIIGGPKADSGLTGRKIIVDTYGGYARHGGGAFSGKDVSKVDRSAAYYSRFVAKAVVAANLATHCEVCLSYAIGVAEPTSILINTFDTGVTDDSEIQSLVEHVFNFKPGSMKKELDLSNIKFKELAKYGHFGRVDLPVKWEHVKDKADQLKRLYEET
ncbi:MAG: methionine adenosyltransferase [Tenericutes bacterium GWC2_34_14]|nr:MAG: methionine adenosyltransferase [Tenericutes bacterium GWA2_35_7]OHE28207.1 MAG: methionine adenosyltransferase [Tenericutes bacterium GWC2_34_14]OHE33167.1 MAG: methionine adenosyltransferase [Tenericutes bacterium GWE2_34_108]OHE36287.1 MAG: methionine adenosyltransferase [Tenericutes bacterium GWF1_35_14]OHE38671.1 MAG: methionine adenosyltransferase [Tenericutes bacterium GWF2_35_184]OHE44830.1 MAG: methionine adenosyltransferase [Tenericutes bacterium RIFOXYA2_FULL_36_32]OHE48550.